MRYVVVGAGAVGGIIGGQLHQSGRAVLLVARGSHFAEIKSQGLHLITPAQDRFLDVPVVSGTSGLVLDPDDVLLFAVKTQDTMQALDEWSACPVDGGGTASERIPVICAQNGVENERLALRRFRRVYAMSVWLPASHLTPGTVAGYSAPLSGALQLGNYPHGSDTLTQNVATDLSESAFYSRAVPDAMRWKYGKLLSNLRNAGEALCGKAPGISVLLDRAVDEGRATLMAAGIEYSDRREEPWRDGGLVSSRPIGGAKRPGGSSWQSLARESGSVEADYLNGEIVLLGRLHGVPTPVNETFQRLAGQFARDRRKPGTMTVPGLTEMINRQI